MLVLFLTAELTGLVSVKVKESNCSIPHARGSERESATMRKPGKIRLFGAMPGTGKSAVQDGLQAELDATGENWIVVAHEQILTPEQRVSMARAGNLVMSSKEFVLGVNLPGQKAFQAHLRFLADRGMNVVGMAPFENVYQEVPIPGDASGRKAPLYMVMLEYDFAEYDMSLAHVLLVGDGAAEEMQRRLIGRQDKSPWQAALDEDKVGNPTYYSGRAAHILKSSQTFDLPLIEYPVDKDPSWLIPRMVRIARA